MSITLVIAEKPSVAQTIAAALGVKNKKDGYLEGGGYLISWCVGHLVQLSEAAAYGEQYRKWSYESLPILPEKWQYTVSKDKETQFNILKELMHRADVSEVVNACDAGREGELIFRFVYEVAGCKKPIRRLWISSMEDGAIRSGFDNLKDGREYDALFASALCRAKADWIIGINATRLFSCLYNCTLNVGRVQTPTLKMLADRDAAISTFKKEKYYHVRLALPGAEAASAKICAADEAGELKAACEKIAAEGITPWFMPGADGWQHQLAFFQIGGVYEEATPGLYDALNTNQATFADNEKMLEVLNEFKELSDAGYFGEDWIGTDSTNLTNEFGDRNIAMAMANSSYIQQIKDDTGTEDEFGMFLIPLGDNTWYPTNPAGPTMFGYKGTEHEDLVKEFFNFVTTTESLQEILDNSPAYTNVDMNDDAIEQHWLPEEEEFLATVDDSKKSVSVLQTGTKYTNDYWMQFGQDMVAFCQGEMEANDVLANMDTNRAEAAKTVGDANWN